MITHDLRTAIRIPLAAICIALSACGTGSRADAGSSNLTQGASMEKNAAGPLGKRDAARIFVSGHSLTDTPFAEHLEAIAKSLNTDVRWNQQIEIGSPIRYRTRGAVATATGWSGYSLGKNRQGQGMNVVEELRRPKTIGNERYDTLVITERHDLVSALVWEDTVRYLRHYHDRLIEGNPQARTFFYESWLEVSDKKDPRPWIAYERSASPMWQCIAGRINQSLAAEGRSDRIVPLPAGAALAELVERATQGVLPGVSAEGTDQTVNRLFQDAVHLKPLGVYYMALVTYSAVYQRSPVGAWAPQGVNATQARSLQQVAWDYVSRYYREQSPPDLGRCRASMRESFCAEFWSHPRAASWDDKLVAYAKRGRNISACQASFAEDNPANPLRYDAATDRSYWYPAP